MPSMVGRSTAQTTPSLPPPPHLNMPFSPTLSNRSPLGGALCETEKRGPRRVGPDVGRCRTRRGLRWGPRRRSRWGGARRRRRGGAGGGRAGRAGGAGRTGAAGKGSPKSRRSPRNSHFTQFSQSWLGRLGQVRKWYFLKLQYLAPKPCTLIWVWSGAPKPRGKFGL